MKLRFNATGVYLNGKRINMPMSKRQAVSENEQLGLMLKRHLGMV